MIENNISAKELYKVNPETGCYIIEVFLEDYEKIFNVWDPAPFESREINPDFRAYLDVCSNDILLTDNIELHFSGIKTSSDSQTEENIRLGLKKYFSYNKSLVMREIKELNQLTMIYLSVALTFVTAMAFMNIKNVDNIALLIIYEGLTIGTWVFAWEAIASFVFHKRKFRRLLKKWSRLSQMAIKFDADI
jgi:hypothetical protein